MEIQDEIVRINTEASSTALQFALLVPLLAALLGLLNGFLMIRIPDHEPTSAVEGLLFG